MKTITCVICLHFIFFATISTLWADYEILPKTEYIVTPIEKIKLEDGANLSGKNLGGIHIHWKETTLKNVNFSKSNLYAADFQQTNFENCDFSQTHLGETFFQGTLTGCNFTDANIDSATIGGLNAEQLKSTADYKRKNLSQIHFYLYPSDFRGVDFSGVDMSHARFDRVRLEDCDFTDAIIRSVSFSDLRYETRKLFDYDFKIEQLLTTKDFKEGFVDGLNVIQLTWPEDKIVNLSGTVFVNCTLGAENQAKVDLTDSVISNCDFRQFKGLTLENIKSTWNYKHNRMEGIQLPEEIQKALDAEKDEQ